MLDMKYRVLGGLDAVAEYLRASPMPTYQERKAKLLQQGKDYPEYAAEIEEEYAVTPQNAKTVERIATHVSLLNAAAVQGKLTDKLYHRLYDHLVSLSA